MKSRSLLFRWEVLALAAVVAAGWASYSHFDSGRELFVETQQQLQEAQGLAQQITLLRAKPDRVAAQSRSEQALAEAIEKSTVAASVGPERIARIEPQSPRRAGDSDYLDHSTSVSFDSVTLSQLATTLRSLRDTEGLDQLRVTNLRISTPYSAKADEAPETWNVELTLTYYVYSPKPSSRQRS